EPGAISAVAVATRISTSRIDTAMVSPNGVEAGGPLPLNSGETVRLSWGAFQIWGVVVRGGPTAQIRFAGLAPDEEGRIREWIKSSATEPVVAQPTAPVRSSPPPPTASGRAAPIAGPPPGFSDRKPA